MSEIESKSEVQKAAEAEVDGFRRDLGPFVIAAETTRMPMLFTNAEAPHNLIIFANDSFLALTGYPLEEVLGQRFEFLTVPGAAIATLAESGDDPKDHPGTSCEYQYRRKDGTEFWADTFVNPVVDRTGRVVQNFVSLVDLTRHKQEQVHSRMLIEELNHRVKNTLATVQSIVAQALRSAADKAEIRELIESRLFALARSHDLLTQEHWKSVGLFDLVKSTLEPFETVGSQAERFSIIGENIRLVPKAALILGIVFHELATNALKHGALSNKTGSILVTWNLQPRLDGDHLLLRWKEKGGPSVVAPSRTGFGSKVIERGITYEFDGKACLDYERDGVVCTMDVRAPIATDG